MSSRTGVRLAALVAALMLSKWQYRFFPCNYIAIVSYVAGVATVLIIYFTAERVYEAMTSDEPDAKRTLGATIVVGCIGAAGVGFFTMMTHLCP
jgi:hypothetical protein